MDFCTLTLRSVIERGNYDDRGKKTMLFGDKKLCQKIALSRYKTNEIYFTFIAINYIYLQKQYYGFSRVT